MVTEKLRAQLAIWGIENIYDRSSLILIEVRIQMTWCIQANKEEDDIRKITPLEARSQKEVKKAIRDARHNNKSLLRLQSHVDLSSSTLWKVTRLHSTLSTFVVGLLLLLLSVYFHVSFSTVSFAGNVRFVSKIKDCFTEKAVLWGGNLTPRNFSGDILWRHPWSCSWFHDLGATVLKADATTQNVLVTALWLRNID